MWESPTKGSIIKHKQPEASQQYQKRPPLLTSLLCLSKRKSITFIPILPSCFQLPIIKEDNLTGLWRTLIGLRANGEQRVLGFWRRNLRLYIKYYFFSISHMMRFINISLQSPTAASVSLEGRKKKGNTVSQATNYYFRSSTKSVIPVLSSVVRLKTCNCASSVCVKSGCRSLRGGLRLKSLPHVEKCLGIFPLSL